MRVEIVGDPEIGMQGSQHIHAHYNHATKCTSIVCVADVITTKIAIEVLQEKYDEATKCLTGTQLSDIERIVKEALSNEEHRSESFESGCHLRVREDDGCNGQADTARTQDQVHGRLLSFNRPTI